MEVGLANRGDDFPFQGQLPTSWLDKLQPYEFRFVDTLPKTPAEMLLDAISLLDEDDGDGGININFEND